jgi:hypothetical protein
MLIAVLTRTIILLTVKYIGMGSVLQLFWMILQSNLGRGAEVVNLV